MGENDIQNQINNSNENFIVNNVLQTLREKITLANFYHNEELRNNCLKFISNLYALCMTDNHLKVLNWCSCFYLYLIEENRKYEEKMDSILDNVNHYFKNIHDSEIIQGFRNTIAAASLYDPENTDKLFKILSKELD